MDLFSSFSTDVNEILLLDAQVLDKAFQFLVHELLELLVDAGVLKLVLIFVFTFLVLNPIGPRTSKCHCTQFERVRSKETETESAQSRIAEITFTAKLLRFV